MAAGFIALRRAAVLGRSNIQRTGRLAAPGDGRPPTRSAPAQRGAAASGAKARAGDGRIGEAIAAALDSLSSGEPDGGK